MTRQEQIELVLDLTASIAKEVVEKIRNEKIPEHWDGHQLRSLLADKFECERTSRMRKDRRARSAYRSDVYWGNL